MVIWQAIMVTSDSTAAVRRSSIEATPFFLIRFFIMPVAMASTPGIIDITFGMPICMPIMGISMPGLPSAVTPRSSFFFSSVRP